MGLHHPLLAPVADKLQELEEEFRSQLDSPIPIIAEINGYIADHGGKRIRPALLLLIAQMLGYRGRGDIVFSSVIEFIHTATLIHDDIIDQADTRRGHKSVNRIWGNNLTVLLGDYLYLKSMEAALTQKSLAALDVLTEVTITMIEGELIQNAKKGDRTTTRDEYLDIIRRKTATLFSGCGRLAALLTEIDETQTDALARYCHDVGMAFQLSDDMLDFVGEESVLGKPVINDLREGRLTLPLIELRERAQPDELEAIWAVMETGEVEPEVHQQILEMLHRHGVLESTSALAHEYAKEARKQLASFPDSAAKRTLEQIPDFIVSRSR